MNQVITILKSCVSRAEFVITLSQLNEHDHLHNPEDVRYIIRLTELQRSQLERIGLGDYVPTPLMKMVIVKLLVLIVGILGTRGLRFEEKIGKWML